MDYLELHKQRKIDMRFSTWNVRSICSAGSLTTVAREIAKYKSDLVGVQNITGDRGGTKPAGNFTFFC
jgi:exonuclease III